MQVFGEPHIRTNIAVQVGETHAQTDGPENHQLRDRRVSDGLIAACTVSLGVVDVPKSKADLAEIIGNK